MKKISLIILVFTMFSNLALSQNLNQTVRGTIIDKDSQLPLIGAAVQILNSDPLIGAITDSEGNFRLDNIPVGRISIQLSYMGYESKTLPNILVSSGKEVVLNLGLQESVIAMEEIIIKGAKNKGEALNDMAIISARSISVEETKRYAGGFDDPSRVVTNYAGVTNTPDGSSDIIVRGNSPKYMQWNLEGVEISSPYHFNDQNSSFGGLSALNNNLLNASDFYTSAFSPQYGNVLSSVFDVKLRAGNNEKFESTFGFGLLGTDITFEGPFKKGYGGSFLVNYRYSTAALITQMGLIDVGGTPKYQDMTFKLVLPTKNIGRFSFFGVAGLNGMLIEDLSPAIMATPGNKTKASNYKEDIDKNNYMINTGMNHIYTLNSSSFLKTSISYSTTGISDKIFESEIMPRMDNEGELLNDSVISRKQNYDNNLLSSSYRGALTYSNKLNPKNKIQIGTVYTLFDHDFKQSVLVNDSTTMFNTINFKEKVNTVQNFISWKHRLTENITIISGIHNMNVLLNNKTSFEPRLAVNWKLNNSSSIHAGYGNHSTMESIHHYYAKVELDDGSIVEPNKDLGLLKAHHYVLGFEKRFSKNLMVKAEAYFQDQYNLPVENNDTSYFATINEGIDYRYVDLVNKGTGKNYGVEITLERFFDKDYFFLINTSLFNSTYKTLDDTERNTRYNSNYLANVLIGKEFNKLGKKKNQTLALNAKMFFGGGQKSIPLLRDENGNLDVDPENKLFWDYSKAYENALDNIYYINLSASYRFNRKKTTHEIFLDLQNVTDYKGKIYEYYDENEVNSVGYYTQMGFFPNIMYRVYF